MKAATQTQSTEPHYIINFDEWKEAEKKRLAAIINSKLNFVHIIRMEAIYEAANAAAIIKQINTETVKLIKHKERAELEMTLMELETKRKPEPYQFNRSFLNH